jgi:hypothetical protein
MTNQQFPFLAVSLNEPLALEKILLPSSKTTESGVVCFFVVWRSVVMTTAFKIKSPSVFFLPTGNLGHLLQFSETGNFSVEGSAGCYYFNKAMSLLHLFLRASI